MATKEDILEQIVEEYLSHKGYFVRHNLKFLPSRDHADFNARDDSNHRDIDVLGFHPRLEGPAKVMAVSCKSWQGGFRPEYWLEAIRQNKTVNGRPAWKTFRELVQPKWSQAFRQAVSEATGVAGFTYVVAASHVRGNSCCWTQDNDFREALGGNPIEIISFHQMIAEINATLSQTLAATEVGRMLQLFRAAGFRLDDMAADNVHAQSAKLKPALRPIPHFRDEAEERVFWETHDSADYVDWSEAQRTRFPNLKLTPRKENGGDG
jgi:hypothetical protein